MLRLTPEQYERYKILLNEIESLPRNKGAHRDDLDNIKKMVLFFKYTNPSASLNDIAEQVDASRYSVRYIIDRYFQEYKIAQESGVNE